MSSEGDAAAIRWEPWSAAAFERARAEEKPILLGISAVWCHWCHVMDRTTYRDETVISLVNERFVPVRVDNDERPDVNARYNMGGWPSTVFLAADGTILTGATYVPPANMTGLLRDIDRFYRERRGEIADRIAEIAATRDARAALRSESAPDEACIDWTIETLVAAYDDEYGGFGTEQKFPHVDALEFLVQEYRVTGQPRLYEMVAKSVAAMASGGMYDHVEGGFFRYSTTRDWSVPHFEKMAEDHAGLLRVLSTLVQISDRTDFRDTLRSATSYVREVLYDERLQRFAGSQDADEAYYALPLEARRATPAPFVDRRAYANWNAALAGAFFSAGVALEDDRLIGVGTAVLDGMHATMLDGDGLLFHVAAPGEHPRIRGLLTDQTAYVRAALDAHEGTGEARFLERARATVDAIERFFRAEEDGFYDRAPFETALGALARSDRPLQENASLADSLLRLEAMTLEERYRTEAEQTLAIYAQSYRGAGTFAASYARALRRLRSAPASVTIVGRAADSSAFRETARRLPNPLLVIRTIAPVDRDTLLLRGFAATEKARAYLCAGTQCSAPVDDPADLRAAFESQTPR